MVEAGPAAPGDLATQGLAGPMEADPGISRGDPRLAGEGADAQTVEVDTAQRRPVLGLQGFYQGGNAGAGDRLELVVGLGGSLFALRGEPREGPVPRVLPAMVVDDGIPQDPVEPGRGRFGVSQRVGSAEAPDEGLLEDIFGLVAGPDPALKETQKADMIVQQHAENVRAARVALRRLNGGRFGRVAHRAEG